MKVCPEHYLLKGTPNNHTYKFATKEQQAEYQRVVAVGGAKGFFGGLAAAIPASYYLNKRWSYYQHLPMNLKAFGVIIVAVPSFVIAAERAGLAYDRSQWCVYSILYRHEEPGI